MSSDAGPQTVRHLFLYLINHELFFKTEFVQMLCCWGKKMGSCADNCWGTTRGMSESLSFILRTLVQARWSLSNSERLSRRAPSVTKPIVWPEFKRTKVSHLDWLKTQFINKGVFPLCFSSSGLEKRRWSHCVVVVVVKTLSCNAECDSHTRWWYKGMRKALWGCVLWPALQ